MGGKSEGPLVLSDPQFYTFSEGLRPQSDPLSSSRLGEAPGKALKCPHPHQAWKSAGVWPDILECEIKWALGSITMNKASGGDGIPVDARKGRSGDGGQAPQAPG